MTAASVAGFWQRWRAERALRRNAMSYVRSLQAEPGEAEVRFVAAEVTGGDMDHARWELRYARRALGLLTAERDALDDRTGAAVAHALADSMQQDRQVAPDKRDVAERQMNARLFTYREALGTRAPNLPTAERLARALLAFGGAAQTANPRAAVVTELGAILSRYLLEANERLREVFGVADLPEDVAPSKALEAGRQL